MMDDDRDFSPPRKPNDQTESNLDPFEDWQGGHRTKRGVLKNQYRYVDGGAAVEIQCDGPAVSFFVDANDLEVLEGITWRSLWFEKGKRLNIETKMFGKHVQLSRVLMDCLGSACVVDHIDGNRRNNRKQNLRCVSQRQNNHNAKLRDCNISGYNGISKDDRGATKRWTLVWSRENEHHQKSWGYRDNIPDEALSLRDQLNREGWKTTLSLYTCKARTSWALYWTESDGKRLSKRFPYTDVGLQKALAMREIVYVRIGNTNGIRKDFVDAASLNE